MTYEAHNYRVEAHDSTDHEAATFILRCLRCADHTQTVGTDSDGVEWVCNAGGIDRGALVRLDDLDQSARTHERRFHAC